MFYLDVKFAVIYLMKKLQGKGKFPHEQRSYLISRIELSVYSKIEWVCDTSN